MTQFSNLSNRVTRNPAYLIGWFRAGRPRLARGQRFRGCARAKRAEGRGLAGRARAPSLAADAQPTAGSQPPPALFEYPARDVNTLTSTHRGSPRRRDQRLGGGLRAPRNRASDWCKGLSIIGCPVSDTRSREGAGWLGPRGGCESGLRFESLELVGLD